MTHDMNQIRADWAACGLELPEGCEWKYYRDKWWLRAKVGRGDLFPVSLTAPHAVATLCDELFKQAAAWDEPICVSGDVLIRTGEIVYRVYKWERTGPDDDWLRRTLGENSQWTQSDERHFFKSIGAAFLATLPVLAEEKRGEEPEPDCAECLTYRTVLKRLTDPATLEKVGQFLYDLDRKAAR